MTTFVLQPCHLRESTFAPTKNTEPVSLTWEELTGKLAPAGSAEARFQLKQLQPGFYVGLTDGGKGLRNFVVFNQDRSSEFNWLLQKDPSFKDRLVEVYRVDSVKWDTSAKELGAMGRP